MMTSEVSYKPMIGVVLINYNGFNLTCDCIDSLLRSDYRNYRIYLIDNASPDGSGHRLASKYSQVADVVLSNDNLGTAGANNLGIEHAFQDGCDAALILNNDTDIPADALSKMVSQYRSNCVVVPLITYYSKPDYAWYAGGYFDKFCNARHDGMGEPVDESDCIRDVDYAPTCCFLLPRQIYEIVGGFDEDYFMYWEDVDYCLQLKKHGIPIRYVPTARILHKVSASSGGEGSPFSYYYSARNRLYGIDKLKLPFKTWLWARFALLRGLIVRKNECKYAAKVLRDYRSGIRGRVELS